MKYLADENLDGAIFRGLLRVRPDFDIVRVQDVGLLSADDPEIILWASQNQRMILTHDRKTMPTFAYEQVAAGIDFSGMLVMKPDVSPAAAISDILMIEDCSTAPEWINIVQSIPL